MKHDTNCAATIEPAGDVGKGWYLEPFGLSSLRDAALIGDLTRWRAKSNRAFTSVFRPTKKRTLAWAESQLVRRPDRVLFLVRNANVRVGHLGISNFDAAHAVCELDSVVKGDDRAPRGVMVAAGRALLRLVRDHFGVRAVVAGVLAGNVHGLNFFHRLKFAPIRLLPLVPAVVDGQRRWVLARGREAPRRFLVVLGLSFSGYLDVTALRLPGWEMAEKAS